MSRVAVDWRSGSPKAYKDYRKKHPKDKISYLEFKTIIYGFNQMFIDHILETGEKIKLPAGLGELSIAKIKRPSIRTVNDKQVVGLPIDWKKTREKGKRIYNFNYHTEGYNFKWLWFRKPARFKYCDLFNFKPSRTTSRLLTHYLKVDEKYQNIYAPWKLK
jgi:hypothetical protein